MQSTIDQLRNMKKREFLTQGVSLGLVVGSALIIWALCVLVTGCESPIVVVLSGSMEPAFFRGDLLFLVHNHDRNYEIGDIVVFKIPGRPIPIVHRVLQIHVDPEGDRIDLGNIDDEYEAGETLDGMYILTKGDNNPVHDRGLYNKGQRWLHRDHIMGRAIGLLPYVGRVTIMMNDFPMLKYLLIFVLGLLVITSKEDS